MTNDARLQILRLHLQRARVAVEPFRSVPGAAKSIVTLDKAIGPYWELLSRRKVEVHPDDLKSIEEQIESIEVIARSGNWSNIDPHLKEALSALPGDPTVLDD
jgi:hypothetical protein